jgi:hypothetical protein
MIKRTTALTFLIIASILLLAHSVVPHHHHDKQICLINNHCLNDNPDDEHGNDLKDHRHDNDNSSDDCVLKAPVFLLSHQWHTDFKFYNQTSDYSNTDGFFNSILSYDSELHYPFFASFIFERSRDCCYTSFISAALGLRAPPVV